MKGLRALALPVENRVSFLAPRPQIRFPSIPTQDPFQKPQNTKIHGCSGTLYKTAWISEYSHSLCLQTPNHVENYIGQNLHISQPRQFKAVLFKGQLYIKQNYILFFLLLDYFDD